MSHSICILDDVELTDEQVRRLEALGTLRRFDGTPSTSDQILERCGDADIVILGWTQLDRDVLAKLPAVRHISVWATGYDYVDVAAAAAQGIVVSNVPDYAGVAVAEHALGLLLAVTRHTCVADAAVRAGEVSWAPFQGRELAGRTVGIVGVGHIGTAFAARAAALGMKVVATARNNDRERATAIRLDLCDLPTLLAQSDVVSLHCPLTPETQNLISDDQLALMRPDAVLINTTRAAVIDQPALVRALREGRLAGAGLDEVDLPDDDLLSLPNVVITPHIGFFTPEALIRKSEVCIGNTEAFAAGDPQNVVS